MWRTIAIAAVAAAAIVGVTGAMIYLAYGLSGRPSAVASVPGLDDSSIVVVYENGSASVRARSRQDAMTALGFVHAQEHGWSMTLWQRTARGRLSAWFGADLLPIDHLTRRLGLGRLAETSYDHLAEGERELLNAYVRGVNSAFHGRGADRSSEFSVLDTTAEPWEPWFPLAVERLFSWLATEAPHPDSLGRVPDALREFYDADRFLRSWLHLHGFEHSMAWTMRDSAGTRLVQRHVYGASALPIFHEVELTWSDAPPVAGAALIGTPFLPAGRTQSKAWAILLSSASRLEPSTRDTSAAGYVYEKVETAEGREFLLRFRRDTGALFFESTAPRLPRQLADSAAVDTARTPATGHIAGWSLRWPGLEPGSDARAWFSLPADIETAFRLIYGDGIIMNRDGSSRVVGDPTVAYRHATGIAVGNSPWSRYAAQRLDSLGAPSSSLEPEALNDFHSTWAAELAPALTDAAVAVPDQPSLVIDALAYLRNWDYGYDRASIAASIFDTWTDVYRDSVGTLPDAAVPDTALVMNLVRYEFLVKAVASLAKRFGEDPSQWRWEEVQPHRYYFPVWSADSVLTPNAELPSERRYASIEIPGAGHATTLYHGPSFLLRGLEAPARWESWISTDTWGAFRYRVRRFPANRFFGRYLVSDRIPDPAVVPDAERIKQTTTLLPDR